MNCDLDSVVGMPSRVYTETFASGTEELAAGEVVSSRSRATGDPFLRPSRRQRRPCRTTDDGPITIAQAITALQPSPRTL
jgi:hypothetical protein